MHVESIPMDWGAGDNYAYVLRDDATGAGTVFDPAQTHEVLPKLEPQISAGKLRLDYITNTHHHLDHAGGNAVMHARFPQLPIVAGRDSNLVTRTPADGEQWKLGDNVQVTAIHTPCHTQDSICYFAEDTKTGERAVFTGDTLFNGGCGRFFEGTPAQMHASLAKLAKLPDDTKVYTGHEYTKGNAQWAIKVDPSEAVKKLLAYSGTHEHTAGVFTIADEREHNLFLRTDNKDLQKRLGVTNAIDAMGKLRELKNDNKGV